jgi:hypothetical protein
MTAIHGHTTSIGGVLLGPIRLSHGPDRVPRPRAYGV